MRCMRTVWAAALMVVVCAGAAFAAGGGGLTFGTQYWGLPDYASTYLGVTSIGGFGYGETHDGQRIGGFGIAFVPAMIDSPDYEGLVSGGIGGIVTGQAARLGKLELALNLWLGVGGIATSTMRDDAGYMVGFAELNLELGLPLTRWMEIVGYIGYQAMGNFVPGPALGAFRYYTPVFGARLVWGSF